MDKQGVFSLLVLTVIALGQAAPITHTEISALKISATQETYAVLTEIRELEKHTVRTYMHTYSMANLFMYIHTICTNLVTSVKHMYVYINRRRHTIYPTKTALYDLSLPML